MKDKSMALAIVICALLGLGMYFDSNGESASLIWFAVFFLVIVLLGVDYGKK